MTPKPKDPLQQKSPKESPGGGGSVWTQLAVAFAVFLTISIGYSFVREYFVGEPETVAISQIANDISAGRVSSITVSGDKITATYTDQSEKVSRKETEASLTETLATYSIPPERLAAVNITVEDEGGFRFWFLSLAPILVPALLLFGVIWYLSRQLRKTRGRRSHLPMSQAQRKRKSSSRKSSTSSRIRRNSYR
jgi:ATP-dependent Zn protease